MQTKDKSNQTTLPKKRTILTVRGRMCDQSLSNYSGLTDTCFKAILWRHYSCLQEIFKWLLLNILTSTSSTESSNFNLADLVAFQLDVQNSSADALAKP